jgi:hypothetical protein
MERSIPESFVPGYLRRVNTLYSYQPRDDPARATDGSAYERRVFLPDLPTDRKRVMKHHHKNMPAWISPATISTFDGNLFEVVYVEDCGERLHVDLKTQKKLVAMPYITPQVAE